MAPSPQQRISWVETSAAQSAVQQIDPSSLELCCGNLQLPVCSRKSHFFQRVPASNKHGLSAELLSYIYKNETMVPGMCHVSFLREIISFKDSAACGHRQAGQFPVVKSRNEEVKTSPVELHNICREGAGAPPVMTKH